MASDGKIKESPDPANTSPPISAAAPPRAAAASIPDSAACFSHLARYAFVVLVALMSASFFVEPFADAAANLRLPWPAVVVTLVLLSASFGALVGLFGSFFLPHPPPAISALAAQREGNRAVAVAGVGIGAIGCLVVACGLAYAMGTHPLAAK